MEQTFQEQMKYAVNATLFASRTLSKRVGAVASVYVRKMDAPLSVVDRENLEETKRNIQNSLDALDNILKVSINAETR